MSFAVRLWHVEGLLFVNHDLPISLSRRGSPPSFVDEKPEPRDTVSGPFFAYSMTLRGAMSSAASEKSLAQYAPSFMKAG